jgi:hypothetical protein
MAWSWLSPRHGSRVVLASSGRPVLLPTERKLLQTLELDPAIAVAAVV